MVNKVFSFKNYTDTDKQTNSKNFFKLFHQNIRGQNQKWMSYQTLFFQIILI